MKIDQVQLVLEELLKEVKQTKQLSDDSKSELTKSITMNRQILIHNNELQNSILEKLNEPPKRVRETPVVVESSKKKDTFSYILMITLVCTIVLNIFLYFKWEEAQSYYYKFQVVRLFQVDAERVFKEYDKYKEEIIDEVDEEMNRLKTKKPSKQD